MSKITITLDAQKLRNLVTIRTYKNKDGVDVTIQEVKFELVPLKETKTVYEKDNISILKTHFASAIQTKDERESKAPTIYIGEGQTTIWNNANNIEKDDDLPF